MLLRTGLLIGMLVSVVSCSEQTTGERDPITGDWGSDGRRLLQLESDGKQSVTGTIFLFRDYKQISSAPIRKGSFDRRNGSLTLAGEIAGPDGKPMPYAIEGTLEGDTLDVDYKFGTEEGSATLKRL